jgi:hypothetical protein
MLLRTVGLLAAAELLPLQDKPDRRAAALFTGSF